MPVWRAMHARFDWHSPAIAVGAGSCAFAEFCGAFSVFSCGGLE